jgi:hypothetical protein
MDNVVDVGTVDADYCLYGQIIPSNLEKEILEPVAKFASNFR